MAPGVGGTHGPFPRPPDSRPTPQPPAPEDRDRWHHRGPLRSSQGAQQVWDGNKIAARTQRPPSGRPPGADPGRENAPVPGGSPGLRVSLHAVGVPFPHPNPEQRRRRCGSPGRPGTVPYLLLFVPLCVASYGYGNQRPGVLRPPRRLRLCDVGVGGGPWAVLLASPSRAVILRRLRNVPPGSRP